MKTIAIFFFIPAPQPTAKRHLHPAPTLGETRPARHRPEPAAAQVVLFGVVAKENKSLGRARKGLLQAISNEENLGKTADNRPGPKYKLPIATDAAGAKRWRVNISTV